MSAAVTDSVSVCVSHPHGNEQHVSFGRIKSVAKYGFRGCQFDLLIQSCCDLLGLDVKHALYFYISKSCNIDGKRDFMSSDDYLSNNRDLVIQHLTNQGLISEASQADYDVMQSAFDQMWHHCVMEAAQAVSREVDARRTAGQSRMTADQEMGLNFSHFLKHISMLPHKVEKTNEFKQLQKLIHIELDKMLGEGRSVTRLHSTCTYHVSTCPGSSGAQVWSFVVDGDERKVYMSTHIRGGRDGWNRGGWSESWNF